jgi:hypothetical protein
VLYQLSYLARKRISGYRTHRYGSRMRLLSLTAPALLLVLLAGVAGCGSDSDSAEAGTQLGITFWPEGRAKSAAQMLTLSCDPPAGTHPNPAEACEKIEALDDPFAPPPMDEVCTEQYGGPQEALIEGTYRGKPVSYKLARTNGCEIGRYEKLGFLLPAGGGGA